MSRPFQALTDAVATVAAFSTAVQLGLLDRIDREPAGAEELARTCGADERGVRLLLGALAAGGFVERLGDGRYRPTLNGLAGYHPIIPMWDHLLESVRTGTPLGDGPSWPHATGQWTDAVEAAAAALPAARCVLDVAAGAAPWSIAFATRNPDCRVTAIDLPPMLAVTRRAVARAGLADRYDFVAGDVFRTPLEPNAYDLIMVPYFCNLFDEAACAELIRGLVPAIAPGGTLAVIETLAGAPGAAIQELSLYLRTGNGAVHALDGYRRWFTDAGLTTVDAVALGSAAAGTVITARRP
jgi:protein-L-isoaspartate O-methyltransferase